MRVGGDVEDREVGDRERVDQRAEGDREKHQLAERRGARQRHQPGVAARRTPQRQAALHEREAEGQHQRIVADLDDHGRAVPLPSCPSCQTPAAFSASATSRGM